MQPYHALLQRLETLRQAGVRTLPRGTPFELPADESSPSPPIASAAPLPTPVSKSSAPKFQLSASAPVASMAAVVDRGESVRDVPFPTELPDDVAGRENMLAELNNQVVACKLCQQLACTRKQTVFGVGNPKPRVVFFGEAPGADEDRKGEPFVGEAGQLLTKIIKACTWDRADVYIMNTLKCRPPGNRNPEPNEVANCRSFFERQLEILRPEFIVCLGAVAAHALLENNDAVGKMRRNFHQYRGATVLVTYHPAYLLRNPDAKRHVWDDMQKLLHLMGIPVPGK